MEKKMATSMAYVGCVQGYLVLVSREQEHIISM